MKIAFTTSGTTLDASLDPRFGRAQGFLVVDTETGNLFHKENRQGREAPQGAGIQAAQNLSRWGVEAVVTGHCGPKAFSVLHAAGIQVYLSPEITVGEALKALEEGRLQLSTKADVESHWA